VTRTGLSPIVDEEELDRKTSSTAGAILPSTDSKKASSSKVSDNGASGLLIFFSFFSSTSASRMSRTVSCSVDGHHISDFSSSSALKSLSSFGRTLLINKFLNTDWVRDLQTVEDSVQFNVHPVK
jgi:hypothetical protein